MKIAFIVLMILVALTLGPMLFLWAVNTLAEAGGSDFYIPHGFWTYLASLVFLGCVGGSAKSSK